MILSYHLHETEIYININNSMSGREENSKRLNDTLKYMVEMLRRVIPDDRWFIGYGTLLGIVRENQCIDHDDDIDILVDNSDDNYNRLKQELDQRGFTFNYGHGINNHTRILKTNHTDQFCSTDFYMCDVDDQGNFIDTWEQVSWLNCWKDGKLLTQQWNGVTLNIPNNYETKLNWRYGDWKTKKTHWKWKRAGRNPKKLP